MKELLPKISEAMNETFVGNYVFSDEELARVYDFTGCLLRNYDGGWGNTIWMLQLHSFRFALAHRKTRNP